jgi:hypothetical protein
MYIHRSVEVLDLCIQRHPEMYEVDKRIYNYPVLRHFASISFNTIRYRWSFTLEQPEFLF